MYIVLIISLTIVTSQIRAINASPGDQNGFFIKCISECSSQIGCPLATSGRIEWIFEPCYSCKYECIWGTVRYFTEVLHKQVPQFYGKWPFIAIRLPSLYFIPIQEFASVIFSLLNLYSTLKLHQFTNLLPNQFRMKRIWRIYSLISCLVWIASTVFHWADFWLTEYLDYFSAFALIVYAFFTSLSFTLPFLQKTTYGRFVRFALITGLIAFYIKHIQSLCVHFDYGYNMRCCVVFWILTATIYSCWMVREWRTRELSADRRSISYLAKFIAGGLASALFEVFDFAPILWLVDAHSLFHLATVPLPYYLINFLRLECEYEMNWFDRHIKIT